MKFAAAVLVSLPAGSPKSSPVFPHRARQQSDERISRRHSSLHGLSHRSERDRVDLAAASDRNRKSTSGRRQRSPITSSTTPTIPRRCSSPVEPTHHPAYSVAATDPLPKNVSVSSGIVRYTLSNASSGFHPTHTTGVVGFMPAQMTDETHLKAETFFTLSPPTVFTSNARTFSR